MNYPANILPQTQYKLIDCNLQEHFLVRYVDGISGRIPEPINVEYICSPREGIEDLSTSLLGVFQRDYIHLAFTPVGVTRFGLYCAPDESVETPTHLEDFFQKEERSCWFISIEKIANRPFPYKHGENDLNATCRVLHTPTRWNFWHFSIRWETDQGPLAAMDKNQKRNVAKKISFAARVMFSHFALVDEPVTITLSEACYCKN